MKNILLAFGLLYAASSIASEKPAPLWLTNSISLQGASAGEYLFKGKHVFLLPARCCDIPAEVFDAEGKRICGLHGGFANQIDKECVDFPKQAKLLRHIPGALEKEAK